LHGAAVQLGDGRRISKPFVFALVCQAIGAEPARERIGVNSNESDG